MYDIKSLQDHLAGFCVMRESPFLFSNIYQITQPYAYE